MSKTCRSEFQLEQVIHFNDYQQQFVRLTLPPLKRLSSVDIPFALDPRRIRQLVRECAIEMLNKISSTGTSNVLKRRFSHPPADVHKKIKRPRRTSDTAIINKPITDDEKQRDSEKLLFKSSNNDPIRSNGCRELKRSLISSTKRDSTSSIEISRDSIAVNSNAPPELLADAVGTNPVTPLPTMDGPIKINCRMTFPPSKKIRTESPEPASENTTLSNGQSDETSPPPLNSTTRIGSSRGRRESRVSVVCTDNDSDESMKNSTNNKEITDKINRELAEKLKRVQAKEKATAKRVLNKTSPNHRDMKKLKMNLYNEHRDKRIPLIDPDEEEVDTPSKNASSSSSSLRGITISFTGDQIKSHSRDSGSYSRKNSTESRRDEHKKRKIHSRTHSRHSRNAEIVARNFLCKDPSSMSFEEDSPPSSPVEKSSEKFTAEKNDKKIQSSELPHVDEILAETNALKASLKRIIELFQKASNNLSSVEKSKDTLSQTSVNHLASMPSLEPLPVKPSTENVLDASTSDTSSKPGCMVIDAVRSKINDLKKNNSHSTDKRCKNNYLSDDTSDITIISQAHSTEIPSGESSGEEVEYLGSTQSTNHSLSESTKKTATEKVSSSIDRDNINNNNDSFSGEDVMKSIAISDGFADWSDINELQDKVKELVSKTHKQDRTESPHSTLTELDSVQQNVVELPQSTACEVIEKNPQQSVEDECDAAAVRVESPESSSSPRIRVLSSTELGSRLECKTPAPAAPQSHPNKPHPVQSPLIPCSTLNNNATAQQSRQADFVLPPVKYPIDIRPKIQQSHAPQPTVQQSQVQQPIFPAANYPANVPIAQIIPMNLNTVPSTFPSIESQKKSVAILYKLSELFNKRKITRLIFTAAKQGFFDESKLQQSYDDDVSVQQEILLELNELAHIYHEYDRYVIARFVSYESGRVNFTATPILEAEVLEVFARNEARRQDEKFKKTAEYAQISNLIPFLPHEIPRNPSHVMKLTNFVNGGQQLQIHSACRSPQPVPPPSSIIHAADRSPQPVPPPAPPPPIISKRPEFNVRAEPSCASRYPPEPVPAPLPVPVVVPPTAKKVRSRGPAKSAPKKSSSSKSTKPAETFVYPWFTAEQLELLRHQIAIYQRIWKWFYDANTAAKKKQEKEQRQQQQLKTLKPRPVLVERNTVFVNQDPRLRSRKVQIQQQPSTSNVNVSNQVNNHNITTQHQQTISNQSVRNNQVKQSDNPKIKQQQQAIVDQNAGTNNIDKPLTSTAINRQTMLKMKAMAVTDAIIQLSNVSSKTGARRSSDGSPKKKKDNKARRSKVAEECQVSQSTSSDIPDSTVRKDNIMINGIEAAELNSKTITAPELGQNNDGNSILKPDIAQTNVTEELATSTQELSAGNETDRHNKVPEYEVFDVDDIEELPVILPRTHNTQSVNDLITPKQEVFDDDDIEEIAIITPEGSKERNKINFAAIIPKIEVIDEDELQDIVSSTQHFQDMIEYRTNIRIKSEVTDEYPSTSNNETSIDRLRQPFKCKQEVSDIITLDLSDDNSDTDTVILGNDVEITEETIKYTQSSIDEELACTELAQKLGITGSSFVNENQTASDGIMITGVTTIDNATFETITDDDVLDITEIKEEKLILCTNCKVREGRVACCSEASYCSPECLEEHWPTSHATVCKKPCNSYEQQEMEIKTQTSQS